MEPDLTDNGDGPIDWPTHGRQLNWVFRLAGSILKATANMTRSTCCRPCTNVGVARQKDACSLGPHPNRLPDCAVHWGKEAEHGIGTRLSICLTAGHLGRPPSLMDLTYYIFAFWGGVSMGHPMERLPPIQLSIPSQAVRQPSRARMPNQGAWQARLLIRRGVMEPK